MPQRKGDEPQFHVKGTMGQQEEKLPHRPAAVIETVFSQRLEFFI